MSDSLELLRRSASMRSASGQVPAVEGDDEAVLPAFGYLRGVRDKAVTVEFRREREGDSVSFPYSWLGPSRHHPSLGILLLFVGSEQYLVTLRGRNLNRLENGGISLYERGLLRHRVTWVQEAGHQASHVLPHQECVVERIEIQVVTPEAVNLAFGLK